MIRLLVLIATAVLVLSIVTGIGLKSIRKARKSNEKCLEYRLKKISYQLYDFISNRWIFHYLLIEKTCFGLISPNPNILWISVCKC